MKKLSEKEMTKIVGGYSNTMSRSDIERHKGTPVGKYDGWEGSIYYIEIPCRKMTAKFIRSYESEGWYGNTQRTHEVEIIDIYSSNNLEYGAGSIVKLNGDEAKLYEYVD